MNMFVVLFGCKIYGMVYDSSLTPFPSGPVWYSGVHYFAVVVFSDRYLVCICAFCGHW